MICQFVSKAIMELLEITLFGIKAPASGELRVESEEHLEHDFSHSLAARLPSRGQVLSSRAPKDIGDLTKY